MSFVYLPEKVSKANAEKMDSRRYVFFRSAQRYSWLPIVKHAKLYIVFTCISVVADLC
jgi:hypothetical protein